MNRKLLVAGVFALTAMVALSGCIGGNGGGDSADVDVVEFVPNEADGVFHIDMAILEDQTTADLANAFIEMDMEQQGEDYEGPESYDEIWEEFEQGSDTEFDPRDLHEAVVFGSVPEDPEMVEEDGYTAGVLSADLTEDEMVGLVEQNATVEADEYEGVPFYTVEPDTGSASYMAVLQEGVFSFGTEQAVRDTVDVSQGDAETLSGDLREELDRVRDGYINFAFSVPDSAMPSQGGQGSQSPFSAFEKVTVVSGSYYTDGDTVGVSTNMRADSGDDAQDVSDAVDGLAALGRMSFGEEVNDILEPLEVERDESTVLVTYETTVDQLVEDIESLENLGMPGPSSPGASPPGSPDGDTGGTGPQPPQGSFDDDGMGREPPQGSFDG
ncbi:MAG: hypothetical protein U5J64_04465 [Halobacteriales archaeon]|nr:hypothetical protein [Halobacteriales archaeon]